MKNNTLFCIHGNSSSSRIFQALIDSPENHYNTVAPDLPGHGNNTGLTEANFGMAAFRHFLLEQISAIEGDIILIGNSLGGHLAIEIAPKIKNLKGLIIMGTPPIKKPVNFEEAWHSVPALATFLNESPTQKEIIETAESIVSKNVESKFIIDTFNKTNPLIRKALANDIAKNNLENEYDIFTKLAIPKYIIAGDNDVSVNKDYLELVKKNCKSHCEIIEFKDCGHFPSLESPHQFNATVLKIANTLF